MNIRINIYLSSSLKVHFLVSFLLLYRVETLKNDLGDVSLKDLSVKTTIGLGGFGKVEMVKYFDIFTSLPGKID